MGIPKIFKEFKHDADAEENGKWAPIADGVEFKIRRLRSKIVTDARDKIYGPFERAMGPRKKDLPDAIEQACTVKLLATAVLVDWRGEAMVDDDGLALPFSIEAATAIFSDPESGKDTRSTVIALASDGDFFAPDSEDTKVDEGNSATI